MSPQVSQGVPENSRGFIKTIDGAGYPDGNAITVSKFQNQDLTFSLSPKNTAEEISAEIIVTGSEDNNGSI
jgi:hypothetical protein